MSGLVLAALGAVAPSLPPGDIRDIRGPLPVHALPYWPFVVVAIAIVAGIVALVLRRKRPRTLEAIALARLERAQALADAGRPREYAIEASAAVRAYLEARFALPVTTATTEEFLASSAVDARLADRRESLAHFLVACDLAKFAKSALSFDAMTAMHDAAQALVTRPTVAVAAEGRSS